MASLKTTLLRVLDAVSAIAGPSARAIIDLAKWVIERFVPDDAGTPSVPLIGAAPDEVKSFVEKLFDDAIAYAENSFWRRSLELAKYLVLSFGLDRAWDAIAERFTSAPVTDEMMITDEAVEKAVGA